MKKIIIGLLVFILSAILYAGIGKDFGVGGKVTGAIFFSVDVKCTYEEMQECPSPQEYSYVSKNKLMNMTVKQLVDEGALIIFEAQERMRDK